MVETLAEILYFIFLPAISLLSPWDARKCWVFLLPVQLLGVCLWLTSSCWVAVCQWLAGAGLCTGPNLRIGLHVSESCLHSSLYSTPSRFLYLTTTSSSGLTFQSIGASLYSSVMFSNQRKWDWVGEKTCRGAALQVCPLAVACIDTFYSAMENRKKQLRNYEHPPQGRTAACVEPVPVFFSR